MYMIHNPFIRFDRFGTNEKADFAEKLGNVGGLRLLSAVFGKIVVVHTSADKLKFRETPFETKYNVIAIAVYVVLLPVSVALTILGLIGTALSESHKQMFRQYEASRGAHVQFGEARARVFDKANPPEAIQDIHSVVLEKNEQRRKIPPVSMMDTIVLKKGEGIQSVHPTGTLFSDDAIVEKLPIENKKQIGNKVYAYYTKHNKAIIQQQATRGCTAAVAAMLIMDHGKNSNLDELCHRNLGNDENQIRDIENAGLTPLVNNATDLKGLKILLQKHGPAIAKLSGSLGGHVIVVDEVSEDLSKVRLRDPYHGWEITVTSEAFMKEWAARLYADGGKLIQVA